MMASILVSGLINIETTLRIAEFPLAYNPVHYPFNGIESSVSGVGYNLAKALTRLGNPVEFLSLIGRNEYAADLVRAALAQDGIPDSFVLSQVDQTAQSVILFDPSGKRQIHVDLKDIQEQFYPPKLFEAAAQKCDILALCNINFSRAMLKSARASGKLVATDVHAVGSLDDATIRISWPRRTSCSCRMKTCCCRQKNGRGQRWRASAVTSWSSG